MKLTCKSICFRVLDKLLCLDWILIKKKKKVSEIFNQLLIILRLQFMVLLLLLYLFLYWTFIYENIVL